MIPIRPIDGPKKVGGSWHCPRCEGEMVPTPKTMAFRGRFFAGLVCQRCKILCDNPDDSMLKFASKHAL